MTTLFFEQFPEIEYLGTKSKDITVRAAIARDVLNKTTAFYPYIIKEDLRPDQVAQLYYGDPNYAWVVWLSNDIIDPYFQWPLTQAQFSRYLVDKYGSVQNAMAKIVHYKHADRDYVMTPTTHAHTDPSMLTGWTPVYAYDYEEQINDNRRSIRLLSVHYLTQIEDELRKVFRSQSPV